MTAARCVAVLFVLLSLLAAPTYPQEQQRPVAEDPTARLFALGMEATEAGDYDRAIEAFRTILVNHPELVRVRLELTRAFFLGGQDGLARRHAAAGGRQHSPLPGHHAGPQAPDGLLRHRHCPGQQPQRRLRERDHLHRHRVRTPALHPRGGFWRSVRTRPVGVGRRRVPAAVERAAAAQSGIRRCGAGIPGR